jgi:hypothetical protein
VPSLATEALMSSGKRSPSSASYQDSRFPKQPPPSPFWGMKNIQYVHQGLTDLPFARAAVNHGQMTEKTAPSCF